MNKYIDAEKLKSEIERLKGISEYYPYHQDYSLALDEVLTHIASLQQEQPEPTCKTCGFYDNNCPFIRGKFIPYPNKVCKDYIYSVMKQQEQPSLPSNLDEAAEEYMQQVKARFLRTLEHPTAKDAFKAGAEWMAGQFQIIEGVLVDWYETRDVEYCSGIRTHESFKVPSGFYIKKEARPQPFRGVESCNIAEDSLSLPR